MRYSQTMEVFGTRGFMTPVLAMTLGSAMLIGGCARDNGEYVQVPASSVPAVTVTGVTRPPIAKTVTGRIETLNGDPVIVRNGPFGKEVGRYRGDGGVGVEIICQAPGADAPGNPADFGKPPLADTTWYRLGDAQTGLPFEPERWIPQNPVFFADDAGPVPSCPLPR